MDTCPSCGESTTGDWYGKSIPIGCDCPSSPAGDTVIVDREALRVVMCGLTDAGVMSRAAEPSDCFVAAFQDLRAALKENDEFEVRCGR